MVSNCLPVGKNDRLVGVVTNRDIIVRGSAKGKENKNEKYL